MKEINIARVLIDKRREKGITQDELADYIGVSKASVSKWETGKSYPDITFLPQLASYFNISIDDLMDYKPQMSKEDIRKVYHRLSADFASGPFDEVMNRCREIIKKYYACFPLLLQMGILIVNYSSLARDAGKTASLLSEAKELFIQVKKGSGDVKMIDMALYMEALCSINLGDPDTALDLLGGKAAVVLPSEILMASAYQMTGNADMAKSILQVGIYQYIVILFNFFPAYLRLCVDAPQRYEKYCGVPLL
jgi:transcriptional regulator with XRE-family HTH domain